LKAKVIREDLEVAPEVAREGMKDESRERVTPGGKMPGKPHFLRGEGRREGAQLGPEKKLSGQKLRRQLPAAPLRRLRLRYEG
jgi:hypothetical protein